MPAQQLCQFRALTLHPTPDGRVIRRQTAPGEQLFNIAQRELVAKIPTHGTQNQLWRRVPPLEDWWVAFLTIVLAFQPASPKLQHIHISRWQGRFEVERLAGRPVLASSRTSGKENVAAENWPDTSASAIMVAWVS